MVNHAPTSADGELVEALVAAMLETDGPRLRIEGTVACGGVGAIHSAFDRVLQRRLAKKTLLSAARDNPALVRAFLREASITAQLDHPNIVPVHDFGVDEQGSLYFTMKLVEGTTLAERISAYHAAAGDRERLLALVEVVARACEALAYAHEHGVLHCDLKAENVMVGRFGQVYLMDWGFAQVMPRRPGQDGARRVRDPLPLPGLDPEGFAFGTPGYMSPEQAHGRLDAMDERSDVFSIGALLYHVLAGHPPYHGETKLWRVLQAQQRRFAPLVASARPDRPRPLELIRVVQRAMARDPGERYASVEDLAADLRRFLHGGASPVVRVAAGTTIIAEGQAADSMFMIQSGRCETFVADGDRRVRLGELAEGDFFGEGALLAAERRLVGVAALTDVVLLEVPAATLSQELGALRPWVRSLLRELVRRTRSMQQREIGRASGRRRWRLW